MRGSHGWAEIEQRQKRQIIRGIVSGKATPGPMHAEIDITDRCNVACYFCNQQDVRTKEQISLAHLKALVDELASTGLRSVRLSGGGDPLFHSGILEFLDHLALRGVVVDNITTNGALLGPELARKLVLQGAREVIFSLNAVDAADYHRMMKAQPATFDRVVENVRGLVAARGSGERPSVVVQFLLDRVNASELVRMYALGRELDADRIAISNVVEIPLERIDPAVLLKVEDGEMLRTGLEEIFRRDREARRLQVYFPFDAWNGILEETKRKVGYSPGLPSFPTAPSFREENGHCFFSWYTATIRGNGEMYPCCLLMQPGYEPMGNALTGSFASHWNGKSFSRMRLEQRRVFMAGSRAAFDPQKHRILERQCVEYGLCWLKNIYFRGDEGFYAELGEALAKARKWDRVRALPGRAWNRFRRALQREPVRSPC